MAEFLGSFGHNGVTYSEMYEEDGDIITHETMPPRNVLELMHQIDLNRQLAQERLRMGKAESVLGGQIPITTFMRWNKEYLAEGGPKDWGIRRGDFIKQKLMERENSRFRFMEL